MKKPLLTNEYTGKGGIRYLFEYYEVDSFDNLPNDEIEQCYAVAFHKDKFLVVNNIKNLGQYTLIGGGVEKGENPDETMIREIKEESNMKVLNIKPIGYQKVTDTSGTIKPFYQLRYFCTVEPYGPFEGDPDKNVTEVIECTKNNYKEYFDWGEIGDRIIERALELKKFQLRPKQSENKKIQKILIIGDAGRGKTTFAEKLSDKLGIPKHSTDDFFWEIKFSKPRGKEKDIEMAREVFEKEDSWIVEGTTRRMLKLGLDQADIVFYLTYKNTFQQIWTLCKRYMKRENETFNGFCNLVLHQYKKRKKLGKFKNEETFEDVLKPYEEKVIRLQSFQEIDDYLKNTK